MMELQSNLVSALLFYAVAYVCISFQFRTGQKRSINGLILMLVIAVFSVKLVMIFCADMSYILIYDLVDIAFFIR